MLGSRKIVAFIPTSNADKARSFYEGVLGLRFVADDHFALVFDANGIMVRIAKVPEFTPAPFTILGWEVPDIESVVSALEAKKCSPGAIRHDGTGRARNLVRPRWRQDSLVQRSRRQRS